MREGLAHERDARVLNVGKIGLCALAESMDLFKDHHVFWVLLS